MTRSHPRSAEGGTEREENANVIRAARHYMNRDSCKFGVVARRSNVGPCFHVFPLSRGEQSGSIPSPVLLDATRHGGLPDLCHDPVDLPSSTNLSIQDSPKKSFPRLLSNSSIAAPPRRSHHPTPRRLVIRPRERKLRRARYRRRDSSHEFDGVRTWYPGSDDGGNSPR